MSGSHKDQRKHRRKVGGTSQGFREHAKREKKRNRADRIERRKADRRRERGLE